MPDVGSTFQLDEDIRCARRPTDEGDPQGAVAACGIDGLVRVGCRDDAQAVGLGDWKQLVPVLRSIDEDRREGRVVVPLRERRPIALVARVAGEIGPRRTDALGLERSRPRQIQREGTALAELALDVQFAAQKVRDLATDRESQTGSTESPARRAIRLLERFEYQSQIVGGPSDTGGED